jgi:quercetin dioxygenase-like cupin family protein
MDATNFHGTVERRDFGSIKSPPGTALAVSFEAGARTHWHRHPGGQVLYILEGEARVGVREESAVELTSGDLVNTPPGEEHWHGAGPNGPMTHLAIQFGDTEWLGPVADTD